MTNARRGGGEMVVAGGKKEKMAKAERGGRPKKQRAADDAEVEARRVLVAQLLMERKNYREIVATIEAMPEDKRPKNVSLSTVSRDVTVLRAEWAAKRGELMEELVGEEVERLNRLEAVWWPGAMEKDKDATDRVLAIQRQRMQLLGMGGGRGSVQVTAGAAAGVQAGGVNTEGPLPAGAQVKVLVTYVDDRRDL